MRLLPAAFLLVNSPYFFILSMWLVGRKLHQVSQVFLRWYVYPFYAWVAMLVAFVLLGAPKELLVGAVRAARWAWNRLAGDPRSSTLDSRVPPLSRPGRGRETR